MPSSIGVRTGSRTTLLDITTEIQQEVTRIGVSSGVCVVYVPHTTAGVTINEGSDPAVCHDILTKLNQLVPEGAGYRHLEGNSDSHIKASLMGSSATIIVEGGRLVLGTWQKVFFCEFDGPRNRKVYVKVM